MPFTVLLLACRKPDLSPSEFKAHYEDVHMPLLRRLGGPLFPSTHTRKYLQVMNVLPGLQQDFPYDSLSEITFEDEQHFQKFMERISDPDRVAERQADEARFLVPERTAIVIVGDVRGTVRQ